MRAPASSAAAHDGGVARVDRDRRRGRRGRARPARRGASPPPAETGSAPGRVDFAADVEQVGAGLQHGVPAGDGGSARSREVAAVAEAVGGDVHDPHDQRPVEGEAGEGWRGRAAVEPPCGQCRHPRTSASGRTRGTIARPVGGRSPRPARRPADPPAQPCGRQARCDRSGRRRDAPGSQSGGSQPRSHSRSADRQWPGVIRCRCRRLPGWSHHASVLRARLAVPAQDRRSSAAAGRNRRGVPASAARRAAPARLSAADDGSPRSRADLLARQGLVLQQALGQRCSSSMFSVRIFAAVA